MTERIEKRENTYLDADVQRGMAMTSPTCSTKDVDAKIELPICSDTKSLGNCYDSSYQCTIIAVPRPERGALCHCKSM